VLFNSFDDAKPRLHIPRAAHAAADEGEADREPNRDADPPFSRGTHAEVMGRLDGLVDLIYERYKDRYFAGEKVFVDLSGDK
jgi:hypothetical protein